MARVVVALCLAHAAMVGDALGYGVPKKDPLEVPSEAYDVNADPDNTALVPITALGIPMQYFGLEGDDCMNMSPITLMYDKGELASIGVIVYGDGDHVTLPEGQEEAGAPPFVYPVSMWNSPPGSLLTPFFSTPTPNCVLGWNAVLYGADPEATYNRKVSVMHVALKSTLDRQCE